MAGRTPPPPRPAPHRDGMKPIPLIVEFAQLAKAAQTGGRRLIYFEASREDGEADREGEEVALDALWKSRELFLSQGDLDIAHWGHLPNPLTGRPMPEYRIGLPDDVKRSGRSIYCRGEVFSSRSPAPKDSSGVWADRFWHSMTGLTPPDRWFPSVYGDIHGVDVHEDARGVVRRKIIACDWYSVGFARRAVHPNLPEASLTPIGTLSAPDTSEQGVMAKATNPTLLALAARDAGVTRLTLGGLAKAMTLGLPMSKAIATAGPLGTDHGNLSGVQALTSESVEGGSGRSGGTGVQVARVAVLRRIKAGKLDVTLGALTRAFEALGFGERQARALLREIHADSQ